MHRRTNRLVLLLGLVACAGTLVGCADAPEAWEGPSAATVLGAPAGPDTPRPPPVPDTLRLELDPLTLDFPARLKAWGGERGETVHFVRGAAVGSGPCFVALGGECLGVTSPVILGSAVADARGLAVLEVTIPGAVGLRDVPLQAVVPRTTGALLSSTATQPTVACTNVPADHPTVQEAVDAALDGDVLCVAAGTYVEDVYLDGKDIALLGEGEASTTLQTPGFGWPILWLVDSDSQVSRFRFTGNGSHEALELDSSDALLTDLHFDALDGNGAQIDDSSAILRDLRFTDIVRDTSGNLYGGALDVDNADPLFNSTGVITIERVDVVGTSVIGGGLTHGAAVYVRSAEEEGATLSHLTIEGTEVESPWVFGALYVQGSVAIDHLEIRDTQAIAGPPFDTFDHDCMPGLFLDTFPTAQPSIVEVSNAVAAGNHCEEGDVFGLGIHIEGAGAYTLTNVDLVGNTYGANTALAEAGALYLEYTDEVTLTNAGIVGHTTRAIHAADIGGVPTNNVTSVQHSNFWDNGVTPFVGIPDPVGTDGNVAVAPAYIDPTAPDPSAWNLRLQATSPLLDAGDPALLDPDGSVSAIGAYGGPEGTW